MVNSSPMRPGARFLVITPQYPIPAWTGGTMRTMHFIRALARRGRVDVAYFFTPPGASPGDPTFGETIQLRVTDRGRVARQVVAGLVSRRPFPVHGFDPGSCRRLTALVDANAYDAILVRSAHALGLLDFLPAAAQAKVVVDLDDDITASLYDQFVVGGGPLRRAVFWANRRALGRYERRVVRGRVVLVCTDRDRARLARYAETVLVVPNVYEPGRSFAQPGESAFARGPSFLFVGALSYPPNIEGLSWFLREVFPQVRSHIEDATLAVVGRHPAEDVRRLCQEADGVVLHADVEDIEEYYDRCRAVVVPLLTGGGTRIKILEASFARRPVLSTPTGAEGLDLRDGKELLLFESATEFLAAYARLDDPATFDALVVGAHDMVASRYSAKRVQQVVDEALDLIAKRR